MTGKRAEKGETRNSPAVRGEFPVRKNWLQVGFTAGLFVLWFFFLLPYVVEGSSRWWATAALAFWAIVSTFVVLMNLRVLKSAPERVILDTHGLRVVRQDGRDAFYAKRVVSYRRMQKWYHGMFKGVVVEGIDASGEKVHQNLFNLDLGKESILRIIDLLKGMV